MTRLTQLSCFPECIVRFLRFLAPRLSTPPQHRMPPSTSFLKWSGGQAVRGSEALRLEFRLCPRGVVAWLFLLRLRLLVWFPNVVRAFLVRWSVLLRLPSAPRQHTSAAPHATDRFFLEALGWAGGSGV